jgi:hypothetical protein
MSDTENTPEERPGWRLAPDQEEPEPEPESDLRPELTQAQIAAAINWLRLKWGEVSRPCPYCENETWNVGTPVYLDVGWGRSVPGYSTMSPMFPVMCSNCGNTVFVNAILAGISDEPEDES